MKLYHYAAKPFEVIDMAKCDGFWMTSIKPSQVDMLDEIGASGSSWVAVCNILYPFYFIFSPKLCFVLLYYVFVFIFRFSFEIPFHRFVPM